MVGRGCATFSFFCKLRCLWYDQCVSIWLLRCDVYDESNQRAALVCAIYVYVLMPSFIRIFVLAPLHIFSSKIKNTKKENVCFLAPCLSFFFFEEEAPYLYFDYISIEMHI
jgi:hypothetical protein